MGYLEKMMKAYVGLKERFPKHDLLSLVEISDGGFKFSDEYYKRFVDPRDDFGTFGYARYTKALNEADMPWPWETFLKFYRSAIKKVPLLKKLEGIKII